MQLDYEDMKPGVLGGLGDAAFNNIVSKISDDEVPFGRGLVIGSDGKVALPSADDEVFFGIAAQRMKATPNDTGEATYAAGDDISVLTQGRIWVYAEEAVDPTDEVWMRVGETYQGHAAGNFRTDDDGESHPTCVQVTNLKWAKTTTEAGLALLEVNLP